MFVVVICVTAGFQLLRLLELASVEHLLPLVKLRPSLWSVFACQSTGKRQSRVRFREQSSHTRILVILWIMITFKLKSHLAVEE